MLKAVKILLLSLIIISITVVIYNQFNQPQKLIELPDLPEEVAPPLKTVKIFGIIKKGETLSALLSKNGISQTHIYPIIESFKKIYSVRKLKPGESYEIETDSSGNLVTFSYSPKIEKKYCIYARRNGEYLAQEKNIELLTKLKYLSGNIQTTLYDAVLEARETPELLFSFTDIFQWDIDFFIDPRIGDRFNIIYEKLYLPETEEFIKYGKILTAQYISSSDTLTAIYFDNKPDDDGYYDLNGVSFQKTFLKSPLNYRRISSYFSYSRRHPILKKYHPHYGIDYAAPKGTPVSAAADGVVVDKGFDRSIGNFIKLRHKNARFVTLYGHLNRFGSGIKQGIRVTQKQVIGYVGSTGLATGPHLHYAFYDNGRPVNPLKIKNTSADPVLAENQQRFDAVKELMFSHLEQIDQINMPLIMMTSAQVHFNRYTIPKR